MFDQAHQLAMCSLLETEQSFMSLRRTNEGATLVAN